MIAYPPAVGDHVSLKSTRLRVKVQSGTNDINASALISMKAGFLLWRKSIDICETYQWG